MSETESQPRSILTSRRWILRVAGIAVLLVVVGAIALGIATVRTALTAENHLHAMLYAIGACHAYVEQNDGGWPTSWDDVEPLIPNEYHWLVHNFIVFDFNANPAHLANEDWHSFTGIQVKQPVYLAYEWRMEALIELLKEHHDTDGL